MPITPMKLFSFLNRDCKDLLPAWFAHYTRLGVTEFRLIHHGPAADRAWLERFGGQYPVKIVDSFDGMFDETLKCERLTAAMHDCLGEWVLGVDSDELLELPYSLRRTVRMLELLGAQSLYAPLLQRISADGSLAPCDAGADVEKLFPLASTHLCERLCDRPPYCQKYPLFYNSSGCRIRNGSHYPPVGRTADELPIRGISHHFKWRRAMLDSIDQRSKLPKANAWEIVAYREYLESHAMKLPLEGSFPYSREKAFAMGLLRRPGRRYLHRGVMMKELRNVAADPAGKSAGRALRLAEWVREHSPGPGTAVGLPANPGDLVRIPLRIAFASWELSGAKGSGGIGTSVTALAELLASAGHEVTIFYQPSAWHGPAHKELVESYADRGITIVQQPVDESVATGSFWSAVSHSCFEWFLGRDFDVIHFPDAGGMAHYTARAKRQGLGFRDTVICVTLHGPIEWASELNGAPFDSFHFDCGFLERESVRLADVVVSPSRFVADALKGRGYELPAAAFVQPNVLQPSIRREAWGGAGRSATVAGLNEAVFFGRIEERKGAVLFCDALDLIAKDNRLPGNFRVTFLGWAGRIHDMPATDYLSQRAAAWNFPLRIETALPMRRAVDYLCQPGCFAIIPSMDDNYPNTVLECLGVSIPALTFHSGGVPEMFLAADHGNALVQPRAEELAAKLQTALEHGLPIARPACDFCEVDLRWLEWHGGLKKARQSGVAKERRKLPSLTVCVLSDGTRPGALKNALAALSRSTLDEMAIVVALGGRSGAQMEDAPSDVVNGKLRVLREEGASLASLMQLAARAADSDYLLFLKDFQEPDAAMAETLLRVAVETGAPVVTCGFAVEQRSSRKIRKLIPAGGNAANTAVRNGFGSHHFLVERRSFLELGMDGPVPPGYEGWYFFLKALVAGMQVEMVPQILVSEPAEPILAPNSHVLLAPYLQTLPRENRDLVLHAYASLAWLRRDFENPFENRSPNAQPANLPDTHMSSSTVLHNGIAEAGIGAEFGAGWHRTEKGGRWTGAAGCGAEIHFITPGRRYINFSAGVVIAGAGNSLAAMLNNAPVPMEFEGDRMALKALPLAPGKNILTFLTRHPPRPPGTGDPRPQGAFFSQIAMEPCNRFGSEAGEFSEWFEHQVHCVPPGASRCVGSISHVKQNLEAWFGKGWHGNEFTHRWSGADGRRSTLDIYSPEEGVVFTLSVRLSPLGKGDRLAIFLNGKPIHTLKSAGKVSLGNLTLQKGLNVIAMESRLAPAQIDGRDARRLGWKIEELEIIPKNQNGTPSAGLPPDVPQESIFVVDPSLWRPTMQEPETWSEVACLDPLILHTHPSIACPLGSASVLGPMLRDRKAHFLVAASWTMELEEKRNYFVSVMKSYLKEHPLHRITFMGSTPRETGMIGVSGLNAITINHNCMVNDAPFVPLEGVRPVFDAVCNARLSRDKRPELAAQVDSVAMIYLYSGFDHSVEQFHAEHARLRALMPRATFVNKLTPAGCEWLHASMVNETFARSRVGLCLSPIEGAMRAAIEYLFAGLPVVSIPCIGGRETYFDDEYCLFAECDPRAIRDAVRKLVARKIPRDYIRSKTLARVEADRARYIKYVQSLIDEGGGSEKFEDRFLKILRDRTMIHWRPMNAFAKSVLDSLPPAR